MARPAGPGRVALLNAGAGALATAGLAHLSVNTIVAAAGMAKGSFYQHWPSRTDYLRELHTHFHDHLTDLVASAGADEPPGARRLWRMLLAYLDGCLAGRASKALLVEARTQAALGDLVQARNAAFATLIDDDLAALGWAERGPVATLLIAAAAEVALHELEAGAPLPVLRRAAMALATHSPGGPETFEPTASAPAANPRPLTRRAAGAGERSRAAVRRL